MKKIILPLIFGSILMAGPFNIFSQDVIIDYSAWNPSSPPCDVFNTTNNVPCTINGNSGTIQHTTLEGDVQYVTSTQALSLATTFVSTSSKLGTRFKIAYDFKVGYQYSITVKSAQLKSTVGFSTGSSLESVLGTNGSSGGGTCVGPQAVSPIGGGAPLPFLYSSTSFNDVSFAYPNPLTSAFNVLYLTSLPGENGGKNAILIQKVTIDETAPSPTFTLTPNGITKACGNAVSQIFTVNNVTNTPGVTSYTWNIGTTPNGWNYLGNPAPATLSTPTNSITLTANACDLPPKNITAAAVIGLNSYTTNASVVTANNPSLSITGNNSICAGSAIYSVDNIPCTGTVSWSVSPSGKVSLTPNGNQVTVNYITNGNIILTAVVSLSCSPEPIILNKAIPIGIPVGQDFPIFGTAPLCINQPGTYSSMFYEGVTYNWSAIGFAFGGGSGPVCMATAPPFPGSGQIILNASNDCGSITAPPAFLVPFLNCFKTYVVSPNPAKDNITISYKQDFDRSIIKSKKIQNKKQVLIYAVKIIDNSGVIKRAAEFKSGTNQANLSLNGLPPGPYILSVFNGTIWESQSILVQ